MVVEVDGSQHYETEGMAKDEERTKYLGMLSSVGATGKQKRSSVYYENDVKNGINGATNAIVDGVNVGEDIFVIETEVGRNGAHLMKQLIEYRNRLSRAKRWKQLDEDLEYTDAMKAIFGDDACYVLSIRPFGGVEIY